MASKRFENGAGRLWVAGMFALGVAALWSLIVDGTLLAGLALGAAAVGVAMYFTIELTKRDA
jgi:hypothetical protein